MITCFHFNLSYYQIFIFIFYNRTRRKTTGKSGSAAEDNIFYEAFRERGEGSLAEPRGSTTKYPIINLREGKIWNSRCGAKSREEDHQGIGSY